MSDGGIFHFGQCWLAHEYRYILTVVSPINYGSQSGSLAELSALFQGKFLKLCDISSINIHWDMIQI
jgi:hypothetical protein